MDRYEEVRRIGKGSEGSVFLVRHRQTGQELVMKKIFLRASRTSSVQEARILSQLSHPHIVKYHESFLDDREEHLCIIQDFCEGGNLDEKIKQARAVDARFTEEQVMDWFVQIVLAMQYVHSKKILHRDLKTQNIFLTCQQRIVKVGDFGIAAQLEHTLEMKRTCVGSPYYMSPEVCQDLPYNNKSDVWALGCILYELCTTSQAFGGTNLMKVVTRIVTGMYDPLPASFSEPLRELVVAMLRPSPDDRPSMAAIVLNPYVQQCMQGFVLRNEADDSTTAAADASVSPLTVPGAESLGTPLPAAGHRPTSSGAGPPRLGSLAGQSAQSSTSSLASSVASRTAKRVGARGPASRRVAQPAAMQVLQPEPEPFSAVLPSLAPDADAARAVTPRHAANVRYGVGLIGPGLVGMGLAPAAVVAAAPAAARRGDALSWAARPDSAAVAGGGVVAGLGVQLKPRTEGRTLGRSSSSSSVGMERTTHNATAPTPESRPEADEAQLKTKSLPARTTWRNLLGEGVEAVPARAADGPAPLAAPDPAEPEGRPRTRSLTSCPEPPPSARKADPPSPTRRATARSREGEPAARLTIGRATIGAASGAGAAAGSLAVGPAPSAAVPLTFPSARAASAAKQTAVSGLGAAAGDAGSKDAAGRSESGKKTGKSRKILRKPGTLKRSQAPTPLAMRADPDTAGAAAAAAAEDTLDKSPKHESPKQETAQRPTPSPAPLAASPASLDVPARRTPTSVSPSVSPTRAVSRTGSQLLVPASGPRLGAASTSPVPATTTSSSVSPVPSAGRITPASLPGAPDKSTPGSAERAASRVSASTRPTLSPTPASTEPSPSSTDEQGALLAALRTAYLLGAPEPGKDPAHARSPAAGSMTESPPRGSADPAFAYSDEEFDSPGTPSSDGEDGGSDDEHVSRRHLGGGAHARAARPRGRSTREASPVPDSDGELSPSDPPEPAVVADDDVMSAIYAAREALCSRAEDYPDVRLTDTRSASTPPRAALRTHCVQALGEARFDALHALFIQDVDRDDAAGDLATVGLSADAQAAQLYGLVREATLLELQHDAVARAGSARAPK